MHQFTNLGLSPDILKALQEIGFERPTAIQEHCIPFVLQKDQDLIALAQTGTGKTAAFSLPLIDRIDPKAKGVQAIILCPTRELALQITNDMESFAKFKKGVSVTPVFGGTSIMKQIDALRRGTQIVVGTPGRVQDLINRKKLILDEIKFLVLDEADEMLNMGFQEEIDRILESVPAERRTLLFSATMPKAIRNIAQRYMKNPGEIQITPPTSTSSNVEHVYYVTHAKYRYEALRRIADSNPNMYAIIFCRTRRETQEIADQLIQDHYSAEAIHGDLSQEQRTYVMNRFRNKKLNFLVATDVAARGIDVDNLTHVINYNLPEQLEAYIHRTGRTGRAHNKGVAISILHSKELNKVRQLERTIKRTIERRQIPSGPEICEIQLFAMIDKLKESETNESAIRPYMDRIMETLSGLSKEDLIHRLVGLEFNRFLDLYENAFDINVDAKMREPRERKKAESYTTFAINVGRDQGFGVKRILGMINDCPPLQGADIGNILIQDQNSYFEIDSTLTEHVLVCFKTARYRGKHILVTEAPEMQIPDRESRGRDRGDRVSRGGQRRESSGSSSSLGRRSRDGRGGSRGGEGGERSFGSGRGQRHSGGRKRRSRKH